jgi:hypothetical protein
MCLDGLEICKIDRALVIFALRSTMDSYHRMVKEFVHCILHAGGGPGNHL